jgi:hypothetical protein
VNDLIISMLLLLWNSRQKQLKFNKSNISGTY